MASNPEKLIEKLRSENKYLNDEVARLQRQLESYFDRADKFRRTFRELILDTLQD